METYETVELVSFNNIASLPDEYRKSMMKFQYSKSKYTNRVKLDGREIAEGKRAQINILEKQTSKILKKMDRYLFIYYILFKLIIFSVELKLLQGI